MKFPSSPIRALWVLAALCSTPAGAADCAAYARDALRLVNEVQSLFTQTLEKDVSTDGLRCTFEGSEWTIREVTHRKWCDALAPAQAAATIDRRLKSMAAELGACRGDVMPRLAAAGKPGVKPVTPPVTPPGGLSTPTTPPPPVVSMPPPARPPSARSAAVPACPRTLEDLDAAPPTERCHCTGEAMRGAPDRDANQDVEDLVLCHEAFRSGLIGREGGVFTVSNLIAMPGDPDAPQLIFEAHGDESIRVHTPGRDAQPPPDHGPGLPPNPDIAIRVVAGTYGANCPGVRRGNATEGLANDCDGFTQSCESLVDTSRLRDPAPSCLSKKFVAEWTCGKDSRPRRAEARRRPEISQRPSDWFVRLNCE